MFVYYIFLSVNGEIFDSPITDDFNFYYFYICEVRYYFYLYLLLVNYFFVYYRNAIRVSLPYHSIAKHHDLLLFIYIYTYSFLAPFHHFTISVGRVMWAEYRFISQVVCVGVFPLPLLTLHVSQPHPQNGEHNTNMPRSAASNGTRKCPKHH